MTLTVQLGLLKGAGLIQLAAIQPELEYRIRHVLVKDAAYHSLVKSDRRALHQAEAKGIQRLFWEISDAQGALAGCRRALEPATQLRHRARAGLGALPAQLADPVLRAGRLGRSVARAPLTASPGPGRPDE